MGVMGTVGAGVALEWMVIEGSGSGV